MGPIKVAIADDNKIVEVVSLAYNLHDGFLYFRRIRDFEKLNKSTGGLGLKNIQSRLKLLHGRIFFEKDMSQTYYKVTIEVPKLEDGVAVKA